MRRLTRKSWRVAAVLIVVDLAVATGLVLGGAASLGGMFHDDSDNTFTNYRTPSPELPYYDRPQFLMRVHGCWNGDAPADMAGKIPGHAVVTPRGYWPMYVGAKLTGQALDQEFGGEDHGLTVHGFCR